MTMTARKSAQSSVPDLASHVDALDWPQITAELDPQGCAVLKGLLTPDQCRAMAALYPDGGDVTPEDLAARGAVRRGELVKILGTGEAVSGLRVTAHAFSAAAIEKITAAGGTATRL